MVVKGVVLDFMMPDVMPFYLLFDKSYSITIFAPFMRVAKLIALILLVDPH